MRELVALLVFLLAVYGVANAVVVLKTRLVFRAVLGSVPVLGDLILCPPCVAFWTGILFSLFIFSPSLFFCTQKFSAAVVDGFAALGMTWQLYLKAERLAADPTKGLEL